MNYKSERPKIQRKKLIHKPKLNQTRRKFSKIKRIRSPPFQKLSAVNHQKMKKYKIKKL